MLFIWVFTSQNIAPPGRTKSGLHAMGVELTPFCTIVRAGFMTGYFRMLVDMNATTVACVVATEPRTMSSQNAPVVNWQVLGTTFDGTDVK